MKILSLFDGISCARVALERAGIPVEVYYASEIDKYAIQVSNKNYPDICHIGGVNNIYYDQTNKILGFDSMNGDIAWTHSKLPGFWNFVCKSDDGYDIVLETYKENAHLITSALESIKETYLD